MVILNECGGSEVAFFGAVGGVGLGVSYGHFRDLGLFGSLAIAAFGLQYSYLLEVVVCSELLLKDFGGVLDQLPVLGGKQLVAAQFDGHFDEFVLDAAV